MRAPRKRHLFTSLILAALLLLVMVAPALADSDAPPFVDIQDCPYKEAITNLAAGQIVGGYEDQTFRPDDTLLRAHLAKMAVLAMDLTVTADHVSTFPDTPKTNPANPLYPGSYAAAAAANNIMLGYTSGNFGFWDTLTRQQLITVIVRAAGNALTDPPAEYQGDLNYSDPTHGTNIKKAEYNGLLAGILDLANWDTTQNATRGETAELLHRLFTMTLRLVGPSGTERLTVTDLAELPPTEGYGGFKNKLGNITDPSLYKGVDMAELMDLVGGGTTVTMYASDGYAKELTPEETQGQVMQYHPVTGGSLTGIAPLTLILAYQMADSPLTYDDGGPLRSAFVGPEAIQVTDSKLWIKHVVKIVVE